MRWLRYLKLVLVFMEFDPSSVVCRSRWSFYRLSKNLSLVRMPTKNDPNVFVDKIRLEAKFSRGPKNKQFSTIPGCQNLEELVSKTDMLVPVQEFDKSNPAQNHPARKWWYDFEKFGYPRSAIQWIRSRFPIFQVPKCLRNSTISRAFRFVIYY